MVGRCRGSCKHMDRRCAYAWRVPFDVKSFIRDDSTHDRRLYAAGNARLAEAGKHKYGRHTIAMPLGCGSKDLLSFLSRRGALQESTIQKKLVIPEEICVQYFPKQPFRVH